VLVIGAIVSHILAPETTGQTLNECSRGKLADAPHSVAPAVA
jgi:hypothetical protein